MKTPHSVQGGFVWLPVLLGVLAVLAASGGAYWYGQQKAPSVVQEESSQPATTTDETAGWKTYTDTNYGFSFKYPTDWFIKKK